MSKGVQETLLSLDLLRISKATQNEIDIFIVAIEMNPAIVSLKGYVNVNRELLTSVKNFQNFSLLITKFYFL